MTKAGGSYTQVYDSLDRYDSKTIGWGREKENNKKRVRVDKSCKRNNMNIFSSCVLRRLTINNWFLNKMKKTPNHIEWERRNNSKFLRNMQSICVNVRETFQWRLIHLQNKLRPSFTLSDSVGLSYDWLVRWLRL